MMGNCTESRNTAQGLTEPVVFYGWEGSIREEFWVHHWVSLAINMQR